MPSHLRLHSSLEEPISANARYSTPPPPAKKQKKMSLTQTYYVASTARSKLGKEASRADHNLRFLVGHANLLDSLMVELADAEREQEAWFNQSVRKAAKPQEPRHVQWIDTIAEETEDMDVDSDSDDESDAGSDIYDEEEEELFSLPLRKIASPPVTISSRPIDDDEDEDMDDDDEDDDEHALERVMSKHSPPELTLDSDSESEDESMPSSPEQPSFELSEKEARQVIHQTGTFFDTHKSEGMEDYILQQTNQPLIAAC